MIVHQQVVLRNACFSQLFHKPQFFRFWRNCSDMVVPLQIRIEHYTPRILYTGTRWTVVDVSGTIDSLLSDPITISFVLLLLMFRQLSFDHLTNSSADLCISDVDPLDIISDNVLSSTNLCVSNRGRRWVEGSMHKFLLRRCIRRLSILCNRPIIQYDCGRHFQLLLLMSYWH